MLKHKKRSKEQRQKERQIQADLYNEAFTHGYEIGLRVGRRFSQSNADSIRLSTLSRREDAPSPESAPSLYRV